MTPYPPNPPENPYRRPVGQGFSATERRDNLVRGWDEGFLAADSWWRSRLVSDETARLILDRLAAEGYTLHGWDDSGSAPRALAREIAASLLPVNEPARPTQRITHGRHCICSACAAEDWTNPALTPCGMHGRGCPQEYAPLGGAGQIVPVNEPETDT